MADNLSIDSAPLDPMNQALPDLAAQVPGEGKREMMRLAKAVEDQGLVDDDMIKEAIKRLPQESAQSLKQALVTMNFASEESILDAIATDLHMERVNLEEVNFTPDLIEEVELAMARKYRIIPVKSTADEIWVAISDPSNLRAIDDLAGVLGKRVTAMFASEEAIDKAIKKYYHADEYTEIYEEMAEDEEEIQGRDYSSIDLDEKKEEEAPLVVKFVDLIFKKSIHERASDIHIEPSRVGLIVKFRVDGVLYEVPSPPRAWQNAITSRIKVLSGMDLAEKRIPLDGRIKLHIGGKKIDLRVSTLPSLFGESIVMRILDAESVSMGLEDVGFLPDSIKTFDKLIRSPNGVILMTGPTGSGKTTTLYAALGTLNTPERKILTLEDPVEYQIAGINQIQINADIGLTFPAGLRALLRQSPDVILVGEIRDLETAENTVRAALTGHLVFSTLHTNDAASATVRLIDMGIKPYLVASSLQAIIAQRLVRSICSNCKTAYKAPPEEILIFEKDPEEFKDVEFFKGTGCERCGQSGYRGRTAIHEILVMDAELRRRVIRSEASTRLKRYAMSRGMRTLAMDGFEKAQLGDTTLQEIIRVVGSDE